MSTNDMGSALAAIMGEGAVGLSATTISRLKQVWESEYEAWRKHPLDSEEYAYVWADRVYFNIRLEEERTCILVVIGMCGLRHTGGVTRCQAVVRNVGTCRRDDKRKSQAEAPQERKYRCATQGRNIS